MNSEEENEIIHRWQNRQSIRSIARELNLSRYLVGGIIRKHAQQRDAVAAIQNDAPPASLGAVPPLRASKLDPFIEQLEQLLERYPKITATRAMEELQRSGYDGGYTILRERIKHLRKTPIKQLTTRFETGPGVQAQMDWATYTIDFSGEGKRRVNLFSYILGYSRRQYICFTETMEFETTIRQHIKAFEHLGGVAATCLYDNMKVVVTRWEDDAPVYNTRFLAFATHYGYKPWACQIRRPQTKGKVERPFHYVETNLLNGREFRSLDHLNETTRWWLSQVADVRIHGTTKKTPLELHAEELPHLLAMPSLQFDTAQVVYRVVDTDGTIQYANNRYSVPWRLVGASLPVRITDHHLIAYDRSLSEVARHVVLQGLSGQRRIDPDHTPPRDHEAQMERLRERFAELGETGMAYLKGLETKQRNSKHQALQVLGLLHAYHKNDLLRAMQRAVQYHAFGMTSLERILSHQATPKPNWQQLDEASQESLQQLAESEPVGPRHSQEYQKLLYGDEETEEPHGDNEQEGTGEENAGEENAGEENAGEENAGEENAGEENAGEENAGEEDTGENGEADSGNASGIDPETSSDAEDSPE